MKYLILIGFILTSGLAFGDEAVSQPIENTQKYMDKVDLDNGITTFYMPGLVHKGNWTHRFTEDSDLEQICEYLGMKEAVGSKSEMMKLDALESAIKVQYNGDWFITNLNPIAIITVIHCN